MKIILCFTILTSVAWAKTPTKINFTEALMQDVESDIKQDEDKFRARPFRTRGPASVEEVSAPIPKEENKIDKNVRQIGPSKW